jgi:effector-binding domain-containing protein
MTVAYLPMRGPYSQIPEGYGLLYGWVAQHGLAPGGMPTAVYLTAPGTVPESEARWELWAPLEGEPAEREPDDSGVGVKRIPETTVVAGMHRGPYETIPSAYEALWAFVTASGYEPAGPPMERYYSDPKEVAPEEYLTEVLLPVRRT